MLLKPTLAVPHGGGKRFSPRSPEYHVLADWIASGAPAPAEGDPVMTRLEVFPASARLAVGTEQPLLVRAHFSDGHAEDVTRWVKFSTNEGAVAGVDRRGAVTVNGPGEAAISAWYLSRLVTARITSPFPDRVDPAVYARAPRANFIDDLVLAKLAELNIAPSPLSADAEFIRRAFLDAAGILPTAERSAPFSRTPRRTSGRSSSTRCSSGRSSSTTGPTNGRTCCWSRAAACPERDVGLLQLDSQRAWKPTSPGTSWPASC